MQETKKGREGRHRIVQALFGLKASKPLLGLVGHPRHQLQECRSKIPPFEFGRPASAARHKLFDPALHEAGKPGQFRVILLVRASRHARVGEVEYHLSEDRLRLQDQEGAMGRLVSRHTLCPTPAQSDEVRCGRHIAGTKESTDRRRPDLSVVVACEVEKDAAILRRRVGVEGPHQAEPRPNRTHGPCIP